MDDEAWLDALEVEVQSTKRRQLLAILRDLDMQRVTVVEIDACRDPDYPNAAITERYDAVIFSVPPSLFGDEEDYDDAC